MGNSVSFARQTLVLDQEPSLGGIIILVIITMIIVVVIIIIIIALKGAIRDFYNLLTAPRTVSNTYAQVAPGAIVCESRATHRALVTCNLQCASWNEGDSSAIKFERVEIVFSWLNH